MSVKMTFVLFFPICCSFAAALQAEGGRENIQQARNLLSKAPASVSEYLSKAPSTYQFDSRFDGQSSVDYTGQSFRHVLISDWSELISSWEKGSYLGLAEDAYKALDSFYSFQFDTDLSSPGAINGFSFFQIKAFDQLGERLPIREGKIYEDIQEDGKQLRNKTAGNDNPLRRTQLKGWSEGEFFGIKLSELDADGNGDGLIEPEDLIEAMMRTLAKEAADGQSFSVPTGKTSVQRVTDVAVMPNGIHLGELLEKFLMGSVSFSQAAEDYLRINPPEDMAGKGLDSDNKVLAKPGVNYTTLEHHWDEGFGYFGAARDYLAYDLNDIINKHSLDTNGDGKISLLEEKNYAPAIYAAKRDLGSEKETIPLSFEIMDSFIKGRHLIAAGNQEYAPYIEAYATLAVGAWEKVLAGSVIHYINATLRELDSYESDSYQFTELAKYWSEMKGLALSFQFNPLSRLSDKDFDLIHALIRDKPVLPHLASGEELKLYHNDLLDVRALLASSFEFSSQQQARL